MRPAIVMLALFFSLVPTWAQSPPAVELSSQNSPVLGRSDERIKMQGIVFAYDWTTRYYMEGARVENFVLKTSSTSATDPEFVRVVLLWHPADRPRILPKDFYSLRKVWQLTLGTTSLYDFVRQYCTMLDAPTFFADVGNGKKVELQRYVSPALLPPDIDLSTNFRMAMAKRPTSPEMPDPRSMPCMYLEKVRPAER